MGSRKLSGIEQLVDDATAELQRRSDRIAALESTERELREAVKVLAVAIKPLVGVTDDDDICLTWDAAQNIRIAIANPIAAAAVREAGR